MALRRFKATITFSNECIKRGEAITDTEEEELREFIKGALECWGGQLHPDDWLFGSLEDVKVKLSTSPRRARKG